MQGAGVIFGRLVTALLLLSLGACLPPQPEGELPEGEVPVEGAPAEGRPELPEGDTGPAGSVDCTGNCGIQVINKYPHDTHAFTQGLDIDAGELYEGTGLRGASTLRRVDIPTGNVERVIDLPGQYFGEGIVVFGGQILQLTWTSRRAFVYDRDSFALLREVSYPTEGWGITYDGTRVIMSDGTSRLYFRDPASLDELGHVDVRDGNGPVTRINELEYIHGEVFANIWLTNRIARIDPDTGMVTSYLDASGLLTASEAQGADVLNGIAYDEAADALYITGKNWPWLFEITLVALGE